MAAKERRMKEEKNQSAILVDHALQSTYAMKKGSVQMMLLLWMPLQPFPLTYFCVKNHVCNTVPLMIFSGIHLLSMYISSLCKGSFLVLACGPH